VLNRICTAGLAWLRTAFLGALLFGCAAAPKGPPLALRGEPELTTPASAKPGWHFAHQAVVAANPLAADAGAQMLRAGGTAIDAAVAAQMVLGLVEPQSSGIGGGAFLVFWDGHSVEAWDGRETAPAAADERLFLDAAGMPLAFDAALVGGRAVGVPGVLRMLESAHRAHGRLPWSRLFEPAIVLAEQGFAISPRLHLLLENDRYLRRDPWARALFYDADGRALATGAMLRNPEYAAALRLVASQGADALYRGSIASAIVKAVREHPANPGLLAEADLARYAPRRRDSLCFDWAAHRVCGMPPPSSGTLAVAQILSITEIAGRRLPSTPLAAGIPSAQWLHLYSEAAALAFADRNQYVADPDFVAPPAGAWSSLLAPAYLARRAALIGERAMGRALPGVPEGATLAFADDRSTEHASTSHLSVIDAAGHALAMTTSIEQQFGARVMVNRGLGLPGGFLLNNELTDFSFVAAQDGRALANRVQGGKRPRSSMTPLLVFDRTSGELQLATGSAGGPAIIHHAAKALLGMAWGLTPQQAADLPNFASYNGPTLLEAGRFPQATVDALAARGHTVDVHEMTSGVHTLMRNPEGGWDAGADPRREGWASGD